jgi:hypothetical protein
MSSPGEASRGLMKCTILQNDQKHLGKAFGTALCKGEGAKQKGPLPTYLNTKNRVCKDRRNFLDDRNMELGI